MDNFNNFPPTSPVEQNGVNNMMPPRKLPNSTAVLVLGILSIVSCCCYGVVSIICGIIAIVLSNKDKKLYSLNPAAYTPSSYSNIKTGKILGIIGIVLGILFLIYMVGLISTIGFENLNNPDYIKEMIEQLEVEA